MARERRWDVDNEYRCALCEKPHDVFGVYSHTCSNSHTHYVCHSCAHAAVRMLLDFAHRTAVCLPGQFRYIPQISFTTGKRLQEPKPDKECEL